jgi:hypothetical protein
LAERRIEGHGLIGESTSGATVSEMDYVEPPSDPNEWTDEQWLEWLKATDDVPFDESEESISRVVKRIVQSTPGQVIGQAMLGMAQAIYGRQDEDVVIVVKGNGETADDEPFSVRLDPDHPERSTVVFNPNSNPTD